MFVVSKTGFVVNIVIFSSSSLYKRSLLKKTDGLPFLMLGAMLMLILYVIKLYIFLICVFTHAGKPGAQKDYNLETISMAKLDPYTQKIMSLLLSKGRAAKMNTCCISNMLLEAHIYVT